MALPTPVVFGLAVVGLGGLSAYFLGSVLNQVREVVSSESVPATVLASDVETVATTASRETPVTKPVVTYRFEYDGETHEADGVYPEWHDADGLQATYSRGMAREVAAEYDPGQSVTANVPDGDPSAAFLRADLVNRKTLRHGFSGLFCAAFTVASAWSLVGSL